jgi:hypothetical protein
MTITEQAFAASSPELFQYVLNRDRLLMVAGLNRIVSNYEIEQSRQELQHSGGG